VSVLLGTAADDDDGNVLLDAADALLAPAGAPGAAFWSDTAAVFWLDAALSELDALAGGAPALVAPALAMDAAGAGAA
jgi:hypothetical protein